jgi:hypothetical protein
LDLRPRPGRDVPRGEGRARCSAGRDCYGMEGEEELLLFGFLISRLRELTENGGRRTASPVLWLGTQNLTPERKVFIPISFFPTVRATRSLSSEMPVHAHTLTRRTIPTPRVGSNTEEPPIQPFETPSCPNKLPS